MRSDPGLGLDAVEDLPGLGLPGRDFSDGVSQSGRERNHFFGQLADGRFRDLSGISGLDHEADGRAFAWLDIDRDGWLDVAIVNANAPLLQIFRNEMGDIAATAGRRVLVVELEGGEGTAHASQRAGDRHSNRNAIGARVRVVHEDGREQVRALRAGEGFAAQNAERLHFGLGEDSTAVRVEVAWPSGRSTRIESVAADTWLRVSEYEAAERVALDRPERSWPASNWPSPEANERVGGIADPARRDGPPESSSTLRMFTSFATWCGVCLGELPQMAALRQAFAEADLSLDGIPVDPKDTPVKLEAWARRHAPAYRVRSDWSADRRAAFAKWIGDELRSEGLPATVVTDAWGRALHVQWGVPTVSDLRPLLRQQQAVGSASHRSSSTPCVDVDADRARRGECRG